MVKILYHHIPKTGGTSLISYLSSLFPTDSVWTTEFIENEREFLKEKLGKKGLNYSDYRWEVYFEKFSFIADHFNMISVAPENVTVVTFLRNPINRTVSQYKDWRRLIATDLENDSTLVREAKLATKTMDIQDFICMNNPIIRKNFHNLQCKSLLLDANPDHRVNEYSDEELLHHAKIVMNRVDFVGITEYMLESINQFLSLIGFQTVPSLIHLNATDQSISLSEADVTRISEFNQADIGLYNEYLDQLKKTIES